jgi:Na+/phosphate symporter
MRSACAQLRSWILHHRPDDVYDSEQLNQLDVEVLKHPEIHFRRATQQVMHLAIEMALKGFDYLKQIGYPADRSSTQELIKTMFHLRGLERFWNTYQQYLDSADGPTSWSDINYTDYFLV